MCYLNYWVHKNRAYILIHLEHFPAHIHNFCAHKLNYVLPDCGKSLMEPYC